MKRLLVAGSVLLFASPSGAATLLRVPGDFDTVLEAVDHAMPGDTVEIGPGTWTDTDTRVINGALKTACAFARGGVVIRGSGADVTTLDVQGPAATLVADVVVSQRAGEGPLRLESMTFTGVSGGDAVAALASDGLEIRSCRFLGVAGGIGSAVDLGECPLTMVDCEVLGFTVNGAILASDSPVQLVRCSFRQNVGRAVYVDDHDGSDLIKIQDCEFIRNRGERYVCVNMQNANQYTIEGCLFLENVAETGLGAGVRSSGSIGEIRFNVFAYDSCVASSTLGAGVRWEQSQGTLSNNTFVGCYSDLDGAAFSSNQSSVVFEGNVIVASPGGAGVNASNIISLETGCNLFWSNPGGDYGNWTPDSTDVFADPLFCDLENLDFTVQVGSPCLTPPTPSCAPIGALGLGCGPVAVQPASFGRVKAMFR